MSATAAPFAAIRTPMREFWRRLRRQRLALGSGVIIALLVLAAVFAPSIAPFDPAAPDYDSVLDGPSALHWLGTDAFGRDILPHGGDVFRDRPLAASHVLNGFGKSIGLMQLDELGQIETPILLTNTLSVGTCANALTRRAIAQNPGIGRQLATVNPVVAECNDGYLNDIQAMAVTEADACAALDAADLDFASGAVGAGAGMSCFGFKGGLGTASAAVVLDGVPRRLGVLALCNFGRAGDLRLPGGRRVPSPAAPAPESGSVIVVMATDIPLEHRQLARVIRRGGVGLARVGSFWGHGSGDLFIGFSTANRTSHAAPSDLLPMQVLAEPRIDRLFEAMADVTEQAVLDALASAETTMGRAGHVRQSLRSVGERP